MQRLANNVTERAFRVENVLSEGDFRRALIAGRKACYQRVSKGSGKYLHLAPVPMIINKPLHEAMEFGTGCRLLEIVSFYRLNSLKLDTEFRVHCDTVIQGEIPDYACVFYLENSGDSGTALFEHPEHGRSDESRLSIFDEDDGKWEVYFRNYAKANSMFIYDSSLFHGRFPWASKGYTKQDGRIVIVKFMKAVK